jgi:hypothetical protein
MPRDGASVNARGWNGLLWDGCDVAILASGESLSVQQCEAVRAWRDMSPAFRKVIVINTTFRRAPWADVLYACDAAWWEGRDRTDMPKYVDEAKGRFAGELWTQDTDAAKNYGLKHIRSAPGKGLSRPPGLINQGANGGYQAIGLAYQSGARAAYLLGYDMHGRHWHGQHPGLLHRSNRFDIFLRNFVQLASDVATIEGFEVVNCTPKTALRSFPMRPWQEVFA